MSDDAHGVDASTWVSLAAGGFGGACLAIVGAPFDVVKVRQQMHGASVHAITRSILTSEGILGLWRGVTPPLLASVPQFAIVFASFDVSRRFVQRRTGRPDGDLRDTAIAGGLVAVPTSFLYTPIDRVKCVLQADGQQIALGQPPRYAGVRHCAVTLWRRGSLFRGFSITLARDVPGWAAYFGVYAAAKRLFASPSATALDGHQELSVGASLAAGALAGSSTWAVAIPFDVVKTRFRASVCLDPGPATTNDTLPCFPAVRSRPPWIDTVARRGADLSPHAAPRGAVNRGPRWHRRPLRWLLGHCARRRAARRGMLPRRRERDARADSLPRAVTVSACEPLRARCVSHCGRA